MNTIDKKEFSDQYKNLSPWDVNHKLSDLEKKSKLLWLWWEKEIELAGRKEAEQYLLLEEKNPEILLTDFQWEKEYQKISWGNWLNNSLINGNKRNFFEYILPPHYTVEELFSQNDDSRLPGVAQGLQNSYRNVDNYINKMLS